MPTTLEEVDVAHGGIERGGGDHSDAGDLHQGADHRVLLSNCREFLLDSPHALLEIVGLLPEGEHHTAYPHGEPLTVMLQELGQASEELLGAFRRGDAEFAQQPSHAVDPHGARTLPLLAHPVQRQDRLLIFALDPDVLDTR